MPLPSPLSPAACGVDLRSAVKLLLTILLTAFGLAARADADSTILIVRHGEKPALGLGQLTCRGLNRSLALAPLILSRYGKPTAIYAPNPAVLKKDKGKAYAYVRPLATIEPLAIRSALPVDLEFGMAQVEPLATKLLNHRDGLQVVAWEHRYGEALAKRLLARLGADPDSVPGWSDTDFDSIYVIRIVDAGAGEVRVLFRREREGLDGLPEACAEGPAGPDSEIQQPVLPN